VRLVDHEERHAALRQHVPVLHVFQPLRRDEDHFGLAVADAGGRLALLGVGQRRVHLRRFDRNIGELFLLILHERDERRHHDDRLRQEERGELIAQRFAGAGREDAEDVAPREDGVEQLALTGAEAIDAEALTRDALDSPP
jgi:hypothetical protein